MYVLKDMLNALNEGTKGIDVREIWNKIIEGASLDEMGFSTEEEKKKFIADNPYESL